MRLHAVPSHRSAMFENEPDVLVRPPTARTSPPESAATPWRWFPGTPPRWCPRKRAGSGTTDQDVPSQCSVTPWNREPSYVYPTAHTSDDPAAEMSNRNGRGVGAGAGTLDHLVPSQCSNTVSCPEGRSWTPTAQTSSAVTAAMPSRLPPRAFGPFTTRHVKPSQCSISG